MGLRHRLAARRRGVRARRPARLPAAAPRRADAAVDGPVPATTHTKEWAEKIASFDGFVIVTPEYNHGTSGVLKNAIDFLYAEWNNKAVGFVSYGAVGGARAVEHLRLVAGELQMADVRQQVALSLITEFENFSVFKPGDYTWPRSTRCSTRSSPGAPRSLRCGRRPRPSEDPGERLLYDDSRRVFAGRCPTAGADALWVIDPERSMDVHPCSACSELGAFPRPRPRNTVVLSRRHDRVDRRPPDRVRPAPGVAPPAHDVSQGVQFSASGVSWSSCVAERAS